MRTMAFLFGLACLALGVGGCDDESVISVAAKNGIFLEKKSVEDPPGSGKMVEKYVVVKDATRDPIGSGLQTARDVAGGIPIAAQVLGVVGLLFSVGKNVLQKRMQEIADKKNAELAAANAQHEATHDATSLGLQNFVNSQPPDVGKALSQHIDSVHDHMAVPAEHQDWIQPVLKS